MDVIEREPAIRAPAPPVVLSHREIMSTLSGLLLGMLLAALDQNIVTTAVPAIANDLGGFEHLSWIFAGYLLTSTASTPIYGKISDLYGRGPLLMISIGLFVASSAFCALAQDMGQLVAARAAQGERSAEPADRTARDDNPERPLSSRHGRPPCAARLPSAPRGSRRRRGERHR